LNEETILAKSANRSGTRRSALAGFSMVELVVSLCIMLILTAVAIPSLMRSLRTYQLNAAAAGLADMLKFTRFEAVRQNKKVSFLLAPSGSGWIVWTGPSSDAAPSPTEKQVLISGFASLVTSGFPPGPTIAGSGALNVLSSSSCTPACFAFDARGAVAPLQAYVLYIGSVNDPDPGYRAVVLLPSGSTQIWTAPSGGSWQKVN
jgi:type IV fimbrial biogenesis protein FimT